MSRKTRFLGLVVAGFLAVPGTLAAQQLVQFGIATGLTTQSLETNGPGFHVLAAAEAKTPLPATGVRLDGMYESAQNLFFGSANLTIAPFHTRVAPYVLGGAGVFAKNDTQLVLNFGVGVAANILQQPLFFESRVYEGRDRFTTFSIGRRF